MKRILVTGNAGSGKSTLAKTIASQFGLPCYSLDGIVWKSGWKKTPLDEKAERILGLVMQDGWVIDGVSFQVQAAADVVIFLDVPRRVSFWRVAKRNWRFLFRSRPGLPAGCPEILMVPALVRIIWRFPAEIRPRILDLKLAGDKSQRFVHVKNQRDLEECLKGQRGGIARGDDD